MTYIFFVKEFDELRSIYIETADNYTQTENMYNIHPRNNESAKESDESFRWPGTIFWQCYYL